VRPISEIGQLSLTNAILDPAYGLLQKLEVIQNNLTQFMMEHEDF